MPLPVAPPFGVALLGGVQLARGAGHVFEGIVGELFAAPAAYRLLSVSVNAGYELELF